MLLPKYYFYIGRWRITKHKSVAICLLYMVHLSEVSTFLGISCTHFVVEMLLVIRIKLCICIL